MKPISLAGWTRVADKLLAPLMRLLSGAPAERPQETHRWHIQQLPSFVPDPSLAAQVVGKGVSLFKTARGPLFHIPILGGWREYVVLESAVTPWHVGWAIESGTYINKLVLTEPRVRLLRGVEGFKVTFFAFDRSGNQVPVRQVGEGRIGSGHYADVRLL